MLSERPSASKYDFKKIYIFVNQKLTRLKRFLPVILLLAILNETWGYYVFFRIMQYEARKIMTGKISLLDDKEQLTVITVNILDQSSIHWIREKKEFIYHDSLYDVVRISTTDQTVTYYCINDTREKEIISDFQKTDDHRTDTSKSRLLSKLIIQCWYIGQGIITQFFDQSNDICFAGPVFSCKTAYKEILTPPPEIPFPS
jgi:hypothetical protein